MLGIQHLQREALAQLQGDIILVQDRLRLGSPRAVKLNGIVAGDLRDVGHGQLTLGIGAAVVDVL